MLIRPIEPGDRDMLTAGFERLSPESRYRRFFSAVPRLTEAQLDYLTRVDHHDHEALLAIDEQSGEGVAVARFVRTGEDVAEPAIAVVDDWQGRGVASELLDALVARAREEGVQRFSAPILADNKPAIRVFERLGDTTVTPKGREVELTIDLPERKAPPALHRLLREVAAGTVRPTLGFWHRLMTRRRPGDPATQRGVVVGLQDAEDGRALDAAAWLAGTYEAPVHLVAARVLVLDDRTEVEGRLERAAQALQRRGVEVRSHLRHGDLAASLLDVAADEHAGTIVVDGGDSGGKGGIWDHVAHHAPSNVLIVRGAP